MVTLLHGDCLVEMKHIPTESVDMIMTSPPYDDLRTCYGTVDLREVGAEAHRLLKSGGFFVMVIQDQTRDFGKSCTTARTIVHYVDSIGFKLFENVIWSKHGRPGVWWNGRFRVDHEFILVFLKGERPSYFTKEHMKVPSKNPGAKYHGTTRRNNGTMKAFDGDRRCKGTKCPGTIWHYETSTVESDRLKKQHPATYPDRLAADCVQAFCPEEGVVLDMFLGSGTTGVAAINTNRHFIGIERGEKYFDIARQRIEKAQVSRAEQARLFQ